MKNKTCKFGRGKLSKFERTSWTLYHSTNVLPIQRKDCHHFQSFGLFCSHGLWLWNISSIAASGAMYCACLRRHYCAAPHSRADPCSKPRRPAQADAGGFSKVANCCWPLPTPPSDQRVWSLLESWLDVAPLCQAWISKGSRFHEQQLSLQQSRCFLWVGLFQQLSKDALQE